MHGVNITIFRDVHTLDTVLNINNCKAHSKLNSLYNWQLSKYCVFHFGFYFLRKIWKKAMNLLYDLKEDILFFIYASTIYLNHHLVQT